MHVMKRMLMAWVIGLIQTWADSITEGLVKLTGNTKRHDKRWYPLNPQLGQLKDRNPIAVSRFSQEQVAQTLAHVAPAVVGLTHMARVLKAGHALEYYAKSGGRRRFRRRVKDLPKDKVKYR
ncbi:hypothetical protein Pmar_PMAR029007 [Perkinsus marinus ATCC 50983]|uniref:Uncharacterized protein n=1 Tax=Perkinsus marinus (strain ATCC 50983 / TXsc) TaxID=423536 RepID=C5L691_PERM5|nr:hypothetical protein Pmar_PMAR029007 [Perkinsus marinus ATCC 50983]EER07718.1 hypothetical protein Pmar_PMAR029007 [Perkinsus marinus ATCC 50983]|eukprot:XP_002775902.1 hypothetical protein Pmar_PMAR029007 [Perkinsus marinus ATCC 50983]